jgi:hypothetical protein
MEYRFKLLPGTSRNLQVCPRCGQKRLSPFIDILTNKVFEGYGRCNREESCGYFRTPERPDDDLQPIPAAVKRERVQEVYFDISYLLDHDGRGLFLDWTERRFGREAVEYFLTWFWPGVYRSNGREYTIHWHIDTEGKIHTGKMMEYKLTHNEHGLEVLKRTKTEGSINWVHRKLAPFYSDGNLINFGEGAGDEPWTQTLYGLQQLARRPNDIVCIVEGYKAALVASIYFPRHIWLAADSVSSLTAYSKESLPLMQPLKGRKVYLLPDFDALGKWDEAAKICRAGGYDVEVHPYMSRFIDLATKMKVNCRDIEDLLLYFDVDVWKHK